MQHNVAFASEPKQRHVPILEMQKNFIPSRQVYKSSGNQIICSIIRKAEIRWVISKNLITMG